MSGDRDRDRSVLALTVPKTIGVAFLVLLATLLGRAATMLSVGVALGRVSLDALQEAASSPDGLLVCVGISGASIAGGALLVFLLRRHDARRYLALVRPTGTAVALGLLASAALVIVFDGARWATAGSAIPHDWIETYRTAESTPLLVLAFVVMAPSFEELFFRGLLHRGLRATRAGATGAIAITTFLFALAHFPEDALAALDPIASGIVLGIARERTGSVVPGIVMHAFGNLQAILIVALASAM